ncbi:PVC-type heme-binding CxxCH protein [Dyadobacter luticola]|uniref:Dehydrogenase n=1 Tax=Dyadobacter luticola TaxID=1979387 RepID=A0A5R9KX20_9BACT|nr:PVC-type heme-binding CxxCH protein [Dyadobacter luticola]TLV00680.1 dehydrogenase [Dyadobacter luticola]
MNKIAVFALATLLVATVSCSKKRYKDALTPEEALKSFQLDDQFKIEVFAAEPFVLDPVDMVFDEQGRVFVVEMPDYPYKPEPGKQKGAIKMLVDSNSDGRIDKSVIFAESLSEATSILPWKGGLLVCAAPNIFWMKDTTGDAKADIKETLFTGFFETNSEAQITNLRFGVDNWIYASNHGQEGNVTFSKEPGKPALPMRSADFRFRLDKNLFEQETGPGQFGHTFDDYGHRFVTQNTLHLRQSVIPWRYTHRHAFLPSTNGVYDISDGEMIMYQETPAPYWRAERTAQREAQYKEQGLDRHEYADDHFTGASGGTFYNGDLFPKQYYGSIFTGEVAGNLIHRDVLTPSKDSPVFHAHRDSIAENKREFLASTDPWFRPANFVVGPDGALYVIDMYRQHIETPVSIPEELKADMDFNAGMDKGRIYKITPKNANAKNAVGDLTKLSTADLVKTLGGKNQWARLYAQKLLLEKQDKTVIPQAKTLFETNTDPRTRLSALYVLEGLGALNADVLKKAIDDTEPGVREHAIILSEKFPSLLPEIIKKTADPAPRVAFQATLSIGNLPAAQSAPILAEVLQKHYKDQWFRLAVLSSDAGSNEAFLKLLEDKYAFFKNIDEEKTAFQTDLNKTIEARKVGKTDKAVAKK